MSVVTTVDRANTASSARAAWKLGTNMLDTLETVSYRWQAMKASITHISLYLHFPGLTSSRVLSQYWAIMADSKALTGVLQVLYKCLPNTAPEALQLS